MGAPSSRLKIYVGGMLDSALILEARERFQHANSHEHYRIKGVFYARPCGVRRRTGFGTKTEAPRPLHHAMAKHSFGGRIGVS